MGDILWELYGTVGDYVVWRADDVFNITDGHEPGSDGGYYELESLLKLKGLRVDDVVRDHPSPPSLAPRL